MRHTVGAGPGVLSGAGSWHQGSLADQCTVSVAVCLHTSMEKRAGTHKFNSRDHFTEEEGSSENSA